MVAATIVACLLGTITLGILWFPLMTALYLMYLKAMKGQSPKFPELFACMGKTLPMLGATIVVGIMALVGLILLVIPGLIVITWYMFTLLYMADKNMGVFEAMRASKAAVKKNGVVMSFLFLVVVGVINAAGAALFWVGSLVTIPLSLGMVALAYKDKA